MHLAWCLLGAFAIANGAAIEKPYSPDAQSSPQATPIVEVIQGFPVETVDEYEIRDGIVARAAPAIVQSIGRYSYVGCYTDGTLPSRRALRAKATQNSAMTIEFCASFCAGYYWFGTEIGNQCKLFRSLCQTSIDKNYRLVRVCRRERQQTDIFRLHNDLQRKFFAILWRRFAAADV
jgi:hypothetical protein